ncbi:hypothetical protein BD289DRAFT_479119 [Coniella lustricola]|uniref:Uncharacterized protein n=1 Tax=Coniella lustricola TaxID=2025994 RepID=A0A2T3AJY8_9PEZI|nr:hypothetical protein BD289DRAFT_479119 [Coniella lustricola]
MNTGITFVLMWLAAALVAPLMQGMVNETYPRAVRIINEHEAGVRLRIVDNYQAPSSELNMEERVLAPGHNTTFRVSMGWAGNIQFNEARFWAWSGNEALMEATFNPAGLWMDVSYLTGWTLPMVCGCVEEGPVIGCNLDLKAINGGQCPSKGDDGNGSCINPARGDAHRQDEPAFFTPCRSSAYLLYWHGMQSITKAASKSELGL